jgi:glycosyltransferase involved in cell wall biosynthesis
MRILVISNLYPPYYIGGYELGCRDVVEKLKARGHEVKVLTSDYGIEGSQDDGEVYRWLVWALGSELPPFPRNILSLLKRERQNQNALKRISRRFRPQIIYLWNLIHLSTSLPLSAERAGVPAFYFVSDKEWSRLGTHEIDPWYDILARSFPQPKRPVRAGVKILEYALDVLGLSSTGTLTFPYVHFVSNFLKQDALSKGKPVSHGEVIPWGIDVDLFREKPRGQRPKRLLYVGQITPGKDTVTAIEVTRSIVEKRGPDSVTLTLVGGSVIPAYESEMKELVRSYGLERNVQFTGPKSRELLPSIYAEHDILLFTSLLDEALAITTLEAMACGLPVVTTSAGGNVEVLRQEFNALIFPKGDAETATSHVLRLIDDQELFERLRQNGRRTVEKDFALDQMVDKVEQSLLSALPNDA